MFSHSIVTVTPQIKKNFNFNIKINGIDFEIKNISTNNNSSFNYETRMTATTDNNNYMKIGSWFNDSGLKKFNIDLPGVQFIGVFMIDYTFNQYNIDVIFSVDSISGDFNLYRKQQERKEKLKKLKQICH